MHKFYLLCLMSVAVSIHTFSQNTSSNNQNGKFPKSYLIDKERSSLLDDYSTGDLKKVGERFLYLNNKLADRTNRAFTTFEKVYLGALTKNYSIALKELIRVDEESKFTLSKKREIPNSDYFRLKLIEYSVVYLKDIYLNIEKSTLKAEDKYFLTMILQNYFKDESQDYSEELQEREVEVLNEKCDVFLKKYPRTKYQHYVEHLMKKKVKTFDWGLGMDLAFGTLNAGGKREYVSNGFVMGLGFDVHYKSLALYTRFNFADVEQKKQFFNNPSFNPHKPHISYFIPELSLGYEALNNKTLTLTPFAGIGAFDTEPTLHMTNNFQLGVNTDIKCKFFSHGSMIQTNKYSYEALRLRLTYIMPTSNEIGHRGNQLMFTVGWGFIGYRKN